MRKELEERLVNLCLKIDHLCRHLEDGYLSEHLTQQIIRPSTSAALNYGEAQGAESKGDFIHKISIILKDLRETQISLKLLFSGYKPCFSIPACHSDISDNMPWKQSQYSKVIINIVNE